MKENKHFQKTACFTVIIWKIMYFHKMNKFKENEQFLMVLLIGQQNEHILRIFKRQPSTVCSFFTENCLFSENEHISVKLQISVIPIEFQKRAFYRLLYLSEILPK